MWIWRTQRREDAISCLQVIQGVCPDDPASVMYVWFGALLRVRRWNRIMREQPGFRGICWETPRFDGLGRVQMTVASPRVSNMLGS
jgi:hypothetical protein